MKSVRYAQAPSTPDSGELLDTLGGLLLEIQDRCARGEFADEKMTMQLLEYLEATSWEAWSALERSQAA